MNWKNWLTGLFWALATGVGGGLTFALMDPEHFNFSNGGGKRLLTICAAFALLSAGSYLKDSRPKPEATISLPIKEQV